jgi:hypothetical protein
MSKSKTQKCKPFDCNRFKRLYEKLWDKIPTDRLILGCPFRMKKTVECGYREGQDLMAGS